MVIHRHGGLDALTYESDWPRPQPAAGDIVVRVDACALNFLDIFVRQGMPGEPTVLPTITGGDIAGVVVETGKGVRSPRVGARVVLDPVWGCGRCEYCQRGERPLCLDPSMLGETEPGGLAEFVKCPAAQAIPLPGRYSPDLAACLPVTFGTAWRMLVTQAKVRRGETVLVLGAGGGVAIAATQIARSLGARVIATASTDEKVRRARKLGASAAINYQTDVEWDRTVRTLTDKRGVDVVVETVGEATWPQSIRALGKGGRLVTCGATSGAIAQTDIRYLFRREQQVLGSNGWTHQELRKVAALAFKGKLKPVIDRVLPLERAADGERALEQREVFGKVVIRPRRSGAAR